MKALLVLVLVMFVTSCANSNWRTASREPAGISPKPWVEEAAVIEFYAADAFSWRGWFAVHTWVAIKPEKAVEYTVYEVVGWRVRSGLPALKEYKTITPDTYWYGAKPEKVLSIKGAKAEKLIPKIVAAVARYPWADEYTLFPGPNSNTFPAWLGVQIPELELDMPFRAIGSGYAD
ncbi:DUF3750 domain-containing protein [Psychrosphaera sp. B3R10]|uniref:DUF3750 domain-containing protein n=1 Tax=unclassified Psychrosphaera TaxID=2641570 RepID=UPI001C09A77E|nr:MULTISPECIES: DUF3750 domain-containing protein [unclassified Psychrosphaera]MBU2882458.1 DUF3750 domain-containing protein [Psychrosphaera sp. I2R16]MBU2990279.1 DUF3750 domain-containing protein [Psychrosphaera sp. B3R10]MDO6721279.1 DUF3750 domain-containing protein [Psychrosphaera sp. 1_MG-2023]